MSPKHLKGDIIIAFDLYGTLLSTESIMQKLSAHLGGKKAAEIAAAWRKYQLEYTWRLNSMNVYIPFSDVNAGSLRHALREQSLSLDQESTLDVLKAYDDLETFPDVPSVLSSLSEQPNIIPFIFSNGTQSMVESSVHRSKSLAPYSKAFKDIITVDEVKKYKPAQEVYRYLRERVEKCLPYLKSSGGPYMEMDQMWLVSGNPFDVVGANVAGMKSAWVDRLGNGWCDSLVDKLPGFMDTRLGVPDVTARSLGEALDHIKKDMK